MGTPSLTSEIESPSSGPSIKTRFTLAIAPTFNITMNKFLIAIFVLVAIAAYVQGDAVPGHYGLGYGYRAKREAEAESKPGYPYRYWWKREAETESEPRGYYGFPYRYWKREAETESEPG